MHPFEELERAVERDRAKRRERRAQWRWFGVRLAPVALMPIGTIVLIASVDRPLIKPAVHQDGRGEYVDAGALTFNGNQVMLRAPQGIVFSSEPSVRYAGGGYLKMATQAKGQLQFGPTDSEATTAVWSGAMCTAMAEEPGVVTTASVSGTTLTVRSSKPGIVVRWMCFR